MTLPKGKKLKTVEQRIHLIKWKLRRSHGEEMTVDIVAHRRQQPSFFYAILP